jgi:hypothetical protein
MQILEKSLVLDIDGLSDGLRVSFYLDGDRYTHRIDVLDEGNDSTCVLRSVEGHADQPWPASPPIQEVHLEDRPDGSRVALCVGMAGTSHWSLSVELSADGQQANFDVACRLRDTPETLGSEYDVMQPALADRMAVTTSDHSSPTTLLKRNDRLLLAPSKIEHAPRGLVCLA